MVLTTKRNNTASFIKDIRSNANGAGIFTSLICFAKLIMKYVVEDIAIIKYCCTCPYYEILYHICRPTGYSVKGKIIYNTL